MSTRPTSNKIDQRKYSDFVNSFSANPVSGQLGTVVNESSVKQAVKNLVLTNRGERLYKADFGGDIYKLLFDNISEQTLLLAQTQIKTSLKAYEPRIDVISVRINAPDTPNQAGNQIERFQFIDQNVLVINIVYRIINTQELQNVNVAVERLR